MRKVHGIVGQYRNLGTYVDEKAGEVIEDFELWFSPRRWRRYGDEPIFVARVHTSIAKLENAVSTWLRRGPPKS